MNNHFTKIILLGYSLFFCVTVLASNTFNDTRPNDISNQKWSTLKSAAQEAKLLPEPIGIGGEDDNFGASVSVDGNRALIGSPNMIGTGAAIVMEFDGLEWHEVAVLKPADGEPLDYFGQSVSLSGDRALVGAPNNDGNDYYSGSAYIYDYDGTSWTQISKLTASDGEGSDSFGYSVSLSGDRALVGALGDDDFGYNSGAAFIYDFDGQNWSQSTKLTASDGAPESSFGLSVSLLDDRALVGSYKDSDLGDEAGSAYVFDYDGMNWAQTTKLSAADASAYDHFGYSVSLSGDRALVGAKYDNDNGNNSGSAYIYDYDGMTWTQSVKLSADDGAMDDWFGFSVSLSGDTALIGAWGDDDSGSNSGSAYVFNFDGINWIQSDKLTMADGTSHDNFGRSVSLSDQTLFIGAWKDDDIGIDSGSAIVFDYNGSSWQQNSKLTAREGAVHDHFGYSVSLFGDRALIGADSDNDQGDDSGSAYIFDYDGNSWSLTAKLYVDDGADYKNFGHSVSLFNNRALVGAPGDNEIGLGAGSAYVFDYDGLSWSQTFKLTADDGAQFDDFGASVSLHGDRALVGAWGDNDHGNDSGSAYIFEYDGIKWIQTAKLTADDGAFRDNFGRSISLSTDRALIGAYGDGDNGNKSGSSYIFDFDGINWTQTIKLVASDGAASDYFGHSVSLSGDRALVGAYGDDDHGNDSGSTYVFEYDGMTWAQSAKLIADDGAPNDNFGVSVSLSANRALIGAFGDDEQSVETGSAYVFEFDGVNWLQNTKLTPTDGMPEDGFGVSVSQSNTHVLIGAWLDDDYGNGAGSAYVFNLEQEYTLNVSVTGLGGGTLVLTNDNDSLIMDTDDLKTLSTLGDGSPYDINITSQPSMPNQTCSFTSPNSGLINGADVTVNIECITNQYSVGGLVSGLAIGNSVTLQNNAGDDLVVSAEGGFTFNTLLDDGTAYDISVISQPTSPNQVCTVSYGSGFLVGENITDIQVYCATEVYTIGGTISGLTSGNFVTLSLNDGDEYLVINSNSPFTFSNALANGSAYDVSVLSNPTTPNQSCTITKSQGTLQGADVTDIAVECAIYQYMIGGYVNGLIPDNFMVLQNNLTDDLIIQNQGAFAFATPLDDQQSYDVTIQSQPNDPIQSCEVINAGGSITGRDVDNVFVTCEFGDDLIYRHGFDTPEAISRALWEHEE